MWGRGGGAEVGAAEVNAEVAVTCYRSSIRRCSKRDIVTRTVFSREGAAYSPAARIVSALLAIVEIYVKAV